MLKNGCFGRKKRQTARNHKKAFDEWLKTSIMRPHDNGRLAQLGEHLPYKEGVTGSRPVSPTTHTLSSIFYIQRLTCFLYCK